MTLEGRLRKLEAVRAPAHCRVEDLTDEELLRMLGLTPEEATEERLLRMIAEARNDGTSETNCAT